MPVAKRVDISGKPVGGKTTTSKGGGLYGTKKLKKKRGGK